MKSVKFFFVTLTFITLSFYLCNINEIDHTEGKDQSFQTINEDNIFQYNVTFRDKEQDGHLKPPTNGIV